MVEQRGSAWCVVHGHPRKPGSKRDKPMGTVIKCYYYTPGSKRSNNAAKRKALALHRAIMAQRNKSIDELIVQVENNEACMELFFGKGDGI